MRYFFSLLLSLCSLSVAYGSDFSDSGIRLQIPDGFSAPRLSTAMPHVRVNSFSKTYNATASAAPSNATLIVYVTDGKLSDDAKKQVEAMDHFPLLEDTLNARLVVFSDMVGADAASSKTEPTKPLKLSGEQGAKKTLTISVGGKIHSRCIVYSALVEFKLVEFQIMLLADVPAQDVDALTSAVEKVIFDKNALASLSIE